VPSTGRRVKAPLIWGKMSGFQPARLRRSVLRPHDCVGALVPAKEVRDHLQKILASPGRFRAPRIHRFVICELRGY
jgi:hypothetical protein